MKHIVRIHKKGKTKEIEAEKGTELLRFLRKHIDMPAPCGGKGTCGKCRVKVEGLLEEPRSKEKKLLGSNWLSRGHRLACYHKINSDLDIYIDGHEEKARITTQAKERKTKLEPLVSKEYIELEVPGINDQRPDIERVKAAARFKSGMTLEHLGQLPEILRNSAFRVTLVYIDDKLVSVEPGDTTGINYGVAVDIGTTTIAAYLIDLKTGKRMGVYSGLNPQRQFGSDVISRINYTIENNNGLQELQESIVDCINKIVKHFTETLDIKDSDIYTITFAGNTTMLHLLMKLPCSGISQAPFIPVTTESHKLRAKELNIHINPHGHAFILPAVSAYIGADTVAAVLSSGMYSDDRVTLLIDLGTNGEMVLGNNKWMYACSTAAGPAFEGANIRNGIGGIEGAIDKVVLSPGFAYSTIGGKKPLGICGSGLIDAAAAMLNEGIIEGSGRIQSADEAENIKEEIRKRLVKLEGQNSFLIEKGTGKSGIEIAVTQKDVRELQNAKAAIAAGISMLAGEAGIKIGDIDRVLLAGGFGYYIDVYSALKIGLLPMELKDRIESIGNASGAGAVECLLSHKRFRKAQQIKEKIKYVELSTKAEFMDEYIERMTFEI